MSEFEEKPVKLTEAQIISSYKMIKGDYRLKVRAYEASDLIPAKAHGLEAINIFSQKNGSADPMVKIEINGLKKMTKFKKRTLSPLWNEVFFFNLRNMTPQQLETMTIKFTVLDRNSWIARDSIIGSYELDLTSVYFALNHELFQIYLTLTDPTDEREGIMGYLKVTLECLGPNDEPNVHDVTTDSDPNKTKEKNFFSSKIKQEGHCVQMNVYRAEALAPMNLIKPEADSYIMCKYSGIKNKTKVVTSKNPEWNEAVKVGCMLPNQSKFITCEVWDYDLVQNDDLIGTFKIPFASIRETEPQIRWANLYGAPLTAKYKQQAELMTLYGDKLGSTYRGRILYSLTSFFVLEPKTETKPLQFKFPYEPMPSSPQRSYLLRVDAIEANELPQRGQAIVHVAIGPYLIKSQPTTISDGRALWNEPLEEKRVVFPCNKEEIPDVIVYFADANEEDRRHSFFRIKASDILVEGNEEKEKMARICPLKEDRSLDLVTDDEFPGFLFLKMSLFANNPSPRVPIINEMKFDDYQLRVHLYIGRNFPPADVEGASCPFVIIRCAGQTQRSSIKKKTLNPGWYETITLDVTLPTFDKSMPSHIPAGMMLAIYDANDDVGDNRDLLGRSWITFKENFVYYRITSGDYQDSVVDMIYQKPRWWNMLYDGTDEVQGTLLVGYAIIKKSEAHKIPLEDLYPDHSSQKIHMFCVGLRNVDEEVGGKKIKALSSSFDISGNDKDPVITNQSKVEMQGISFNSYLPITVDVPKNKHLCPVLDCYTWDHSKNPNSSEEKELLGLCTIELKQLLSKYYMTNSQRELLELEQDENDIADKLNKELEADLMGGMRFDDKLGYEEISDEDLFKTIGNELPRLRKILKDEEYEIVIRDQSTKKKLFLEQSILRSKRRPRKESSFLHLDDHSIKEQEVEEEAEEIGKKESIGREVEVEVEDEEEELLGRKVERRVEEVKETHPERSNINVKMMPKSVDESPENEENRKTPPNPPIRRPSNPIQNVSSLHSLQFREDEDVPLVSPQTPPIPSLRQVQLQPHPQKREVLDPSFIKPSVNNETPNDNPLFESQKDLLPAKPLLDDRNEMTAEKEKILKSPERVKSAKKTKEKEEKDGLYIIETMKVTSEMSISSASKIDSGAISLAQLPPDNLRITGKKKKAEEVKAQSNLKLLSKAFSRKFFNKMKKNEEHYEEFDTEEDEDLDITPEWMKGRERFTDDLEDFIKMDKYIRRFPVMTGRTRGKKIVFNTDSGAMRQEVCLLKCIFIEGKTEDDKNVEKKVEKLRKLMRPQKYVCRSYVMTGRDIQSTNEGKPNCYLKVTMCGKTIDDKPLSLRKDTYQPEFYRCFEHLCSIPGSAFLRIEVWNATENLGIGETDEMIGYTEIDMEDRYFTSKWRNYLKKPIEMRNLKSETMMGSMGRLELWVEIIPKVLALKYPKLDFIPPPKYTFELRTIVWSTIDCVFKDELEKCNDIYCRGGPANMEALETDTHWRCREKGSFNWRWKFKVSYPLRTEDDYGADRFKISLWDKDIIGSDEMIGEVDIDLNMHKMIAKACKRLKPIKMLKMCVERGGERTDRMWFDVYHPTALDPDGKPLSQGKVQLSFELVPEKESEKKQNGYGRDNPNLYPTLPDPEGRFKFDFLNPCGMLKEILGPELFRKCWGTICGIILCIILIYLGYVILTQGAAVAIFG